MLSFYLAKASAYGLLGGIMGSFGKVVVLMEWQQVLSVIVGLFILIMSLLPALRHLRVRFLFQKQFGALHAHIQKKPRLRYFLALGFLNGLLPCGMVYVALATAALAGGISGGAFAMLLFGIGTTPALILLVCFKQRLSGKWRTRLLPLSSIVSVVIGILLILRGLNLGVPLISPQTTETGATQCCHK